MPQNKKKQPKSPSTKKSWFYFNISLRVLHSLFLVAISFLILGGSLALGIGVGYFAFLVEDTAAPSKEELQQELTDITETSQLAYADGSKIATIRSDLMRTSVSSDKISDYLKKAIIATEDEYFNQHNGVVPKAVVRALLSEATGFGGGGGSTLTQQLVKQQILSSETTFKRKANEILLAMEVEKFFSKDEIVTMYLNISPFGRNNKGQNIAGVQEAAQGIFGVNAADLTLPQAAFIAGLPQSPIVYSPYTNTGEIKENLSAGLDRKDFVLFSMYRNHDISKKEYDEAMAYDLKQDFKKQEAIEQTDQSFLYYTVLNEAKDIIAKQLADEDKVSAEEYSKEETYQKYLELAQQKLVNGGYTVTSTIDKNIYNAMQDAVSKYGYMLDNWGDAPIEVGNVMMDNATGRVLGFIGGRDYQQNQFNHAFDAQRQAGSSIKPMLVYGPAIDEGLMGSESMVSDYAAKWRTGENADEPIVNATNMGTNTFMSIRESLEVSSNIAATNIFQDIWEQEGDPFFSYKNYLSKMNYPEDNSWAYESAPLGVTNVTVLTQTNGFQTLANKGVYQEGYVIESIKNNEGEVLYQHEQKPVQVFSEATASIMNDMMRSVIDEQKTSNFKSVVSGLDWNLGNADWVGKTGSTNNWSDSWLVVSTPSITISSWSGRDDNKATDSSAGTRTAQYMAYLINRIYQSDQKVFGVDKKFELSDDVKKVKVSKATGTLPGGTVTVDNTRRTNPSETVTSYWTKGGPKEASFEFGIGGSNANYADYWKKIAPSRTTTSTSTNTATNNGSRSTNKEENATNNNNNQKEAEKTEEKKNEQKEDD
ncbi:transglycosylase domain-containing protein [Enterococcus gallinarum]|uniref:transglycosylase domain-containing protein n=1 Tax=Enterococcus gallinarum TaxID=1353 RepID=UPI0012E2BFEC|nr:transglycosylase domain-containing protein [Enterococcus gallinarum]MUO33652.1 penicillin-binding protein [Enterococcus gallinarum]